MILQLLAYYYCNYSTFIFKDKYSGKATLSVVFIYKIHSCQHHLWWCGQARLPEGRYVPTSPPIMTHCMKCTSKYRMAPNFHALKFSWSCLVFVIHWLFVILKSQVLYYKLLSRKFHDKNFCDHCEIHENHENIRSQKFGAIRYVNRLLNFAFSIQW